MRTSRTQLALLALPIMAHAVTLSDFQSGNIRNNDVLSSACHAVYFQSIDGCGETDFTDPPCSKNCVTALVDLIGTVYAACSKDGLKGPSILFQYLNGNGPQALCANDPTVSASAAAEYSALQTGVESSTSAAGYGTSTPSPQPTAASTTSVPTTSSSIVVATSSTASSTTLASSVTDAFATSSETTTSPAATATETSLVIDTSSSPSAQSIASSTSSAESSSQTNLNDHSGGGSPFDTGNSGSSAATTTKSSALALLLAVAGAMLALQ